MNVIHFKRDTSFRKGLFTSDSFAHPAKMDSQLLLWIVEKFTAPGETILDPMFGSGTTMLACILGRNVIGVELEQKFVDMAKANWEKVRQRPQLGSAMGECQILQGDARDLENILCDKIITSPPYAETLQADKDQGQARVKRLRDSGHNDIADRIEKAHNWHQHEADYNPDNTSNISNLPYGQIDKIITSPPYAEAHDTGNLGVGDGDRKDLRAYSYLKESEANISNLPYCSIDSVITSPPYEATFNEKQHTLSGIAKRDPSMRKEVGGYSGIKRIDSIITSPPYEGSLQGTVEDKISSGFNSPEAIKIIQGQARGYSEEPDNIGNLKSASYLEAMKTVYEQCFAVLKSGGLMILVTKNFIRNQKEVRLDLNTIKLCEQEGFVFQERWYRELPAQSFWRVIYKKKFPNAPELKYEDCLIFQKRL